MKLKRLVYYNTKKTEMQIFNHELPVDAKEKKWKITENSGYFNYLGVWTENTSKDFAVRKALAWNEGHKMRKI